MRRTAGWEISSSTTSAASGPSWVSRLTTPGGRPASLRARAISPCVRGQTSDALRITVFPNASGCATARVPRITGAFQGAMPSTTPAGWRMPKAREAGHVGGDDLAGDGGGLRRRLGEHPGGEVGVEHAPAERAAGLLRDDAGDVLGALLEQPGSLLEQLSAAFGGVAAHSGKAAAAASAAAWASSRLAAAALPTVSPVNGSVCSNELPEPAPFHSPPISRSCCSSSTVLMRLSSSDLPSAAAMSGYLRQARRCDRSVDPPGAVHRAR